MGMRVSLKDGAKLLRALGFDNPRILAVPEKVAVRINGLHDGLPSGYHEPTDPEDIKLFKNVLRTLQDEGEGAVEVFGDGEAPPNGEAGGKSKGGKAKKSEGKPKASKDGKPAKPAAAKSGQTRTGPSVMDVICDVLKKGSKSKPVAKDTILPAVAKATGRDADDHLRSTVSTYLSDLTRGYYEQKRGLKAERTDKGLWLSKSGK